MRLYAPLKLTGLADGGKKCRTSKSQIDTFSVPGLRSLVRVAKNSRLLLTAPGNAPEGICRVKPIIYYGLILVTHSTGFIPGTRSRSQTLSIRHSPGIATTAAAASAESR